MPLEHVTRVSWVVTPKKRLEKKEPSAARTTHAMDVSINTDHIINIEKIVQDDIDTLSIEIDTVEIHGEQKKYRRRNITTVMAAVLVVEEQTCTAHLRTGSSNSPMTKECHQWIHIMLKELRTRSNNGTVKDLHKCINNSTVTEPHRRRRIMAATITAVTVANRSGLTDTQIRIHPRAVVLLEAHPRGERMTMKC